ncbi:MAG TPA: response regulator transcription factor [Acidobacteriota bacterium]|jgi:DNA-binding response OmpR family regulator
MSTLLIVEDEKHLADGLRFNLEAEGYKVDLTADGETALDLLKAEPRRYDAVVLDVMLPGKDGFEVVSELRRDGQFLPVLMLTARGRSEDVLRGFEAGADDYLPKPFELEILLARLRGLLRRHSWAQGRREALGVNPQTTPPVGGQSTTPSERHGEDIFSFDGKTIDFGALELHTAGQTIRLTLMETELLRYLIRHEGKVVSRKAMLEDIWGLREDTDTRAIDNFIARLRKYIEEEPSKPRRLLTVRGVGYQFRNMK